MTIPSVKGAMLLPWVIAVRRGRDQGRISTAALSRLDARTRELLNERIQPTQWYPMKPFRELLDLDWEVNGQHAPDYRRRVGARNAVFMARSGHYPQIEHAKRASRPRSATELLDQVRVSSSVASIYYNFLEVDVQIDPERSNVLQIIYSNTDPFPDALRYSTEGFMNELNRMRGSERKWNSERVADKIVFSLEMRKRPARSAGS